MEERLEKIPIWKIVLSIFFVITLTGLPILHISYAPGVEISQTAKIVGLIAVAIALILTYVLGVLMIIKDIINKFRRIKADNKDFFIFWILFCMGVLILDIFLGTIWSKVNWVSWMKLLD